MNRHVRTNTAKLHKKRFVQFIRMAVFRDLDPAIRRTQALKDYLRLNLSPIAISERIAITAIIASKGALDEVGVVWNISVS
ncbi:MAG: hypothetical protein EF813_04340, partial [Methanosarcinales archaeon]